MFITAICVLFLVKLRWPKNKSLYDKVLFYRLKDREIVNSRNNSK